MPSKFTHFKQLQQRMSRKLNYGKNEINSLTEPLSKMMVEYFNQDCAFSDCLDDDFISSFSQEQAIGPATLLIALIYIDRLKHAQQGVPTTHQKQQPFNPSELYLSSVILASKYLNDAGMDDFVWNDEWASSSGFTLAKVNELELKLLDELEWNILVPEKLFNDAFNSIEHWVAADFLNRNGFLTYNELNIFFSHMHPTFLALLKQFVFLITLLMTTYFCVVLSLLLLPSSLNQRQSQNYMLQVHNSSLAQIGVQSSTQFLLTNPAKSVLLNQIVDHKYPFVF